MKGDSQVLFIYPYFCFGLEKDLEGGTGHLSMLLLWFLWRFSRAVLPRPRFRGCGAVAVASVLVPFTFLAKFSVRPFFPIGPLPFDDEEP